MDAVTLASVTEISATSADSFDDALKRGVARDSKTLRDVKSAWVKEQSIRARTTRSRIIR